MIETWRQVKELGITHAIIASDTRRHAADVNAALEAGCHVLVEKPMAIDAANARQAWRSAKQFDLNMWVGCSMRFHQGLNIFRGQLPQIGKIHSVRIECQSYLPDWRPQRPYKDSYSARHDEGGVLRDLIHEIDYAGWLFGWANKVFGKVRVTQTLDIAAEDAVDILWETDSGIVISITLDYLSRPERRQMRAFGEFGTLEWDGLAGRVLFERAGEAPREIVTTQTRDDMYLEQDLAFLNASQESQVPDDRLATAADGIRALEICEAVRTASLDTHEVEVNYSEGT